MDGFFAQYTSVPQGFQIPAVNAGAGTSTIPSKPAVKPFARVRPAPPVQPPAPTAKYVPPPPPPKPTERHRPVNPVRNRGQENAGKDRTVPVPRPNGKRPGEWSCNSMQTIVIFFCKHKVRLIYLAIFCVQLLRTQRVPKPVKGREQLRAVSAPVNLVS